jgi:hypothetical protein
LRRLFFSLLMLAFCLLSACSRDDPEAALNKATDTLEAALEARDSRRVLDLLHPDFAAQSPEEEGKAWAQRTMSLMFTRYRNVSVMVLGRTHHIDARLPDRATSEAEVALVGAEGLLPENARRYHVKLGWIREGDAWKLLRLEWK